MTRATIQCPRCDATTDVPVDALLVALVVDDQDPDLAAILGWLCLSCGDLTQIPIGWAALLTLVTAGAELLAGDEPDEPAALPPHPETPAGGPVFTSDDLLELHELLCSDSWFDAVTSRCTRP